MLLTQENRKALPRLYEMDGNPETKAVVKFFDSGGVATWWATEFDGEDTFFGFADLGLGQGCAELGYFSLSELQSLGRIERDRYFTPRLLSDIIAEAKAAGR